MKITHDKEANAMIIYLRENSPASTEKTVTPDCRIGLDEHGNAVFIELLNVSEQITDLTKVDFLQVTRYWQQNA